MYPAIASNLKKGKGGLYIAAWDGGSPPAEADIGREVGNCESMQYSPQDVQTSEKYSSTQAAAPLIAREVNRASWRFSVECDEHNLNNLLMFFGASQDDLSQGSESSVNGQLESVQPDRSYFLGAYHISGHQLMVASTALVEGEDFVLYPERGVVKFLSTSEVVTGGQDVDYSYARAERTFSRINVGQNLNRQVKLSYFADDSNVDGVAARDIFVIPRASVVLEGDYELISEEFGTYQLNFDALDASAWYPGRGLGWILRGAA